MKRLLVPMVFFSTAAVAQQPATPHVQLTPKWKDAPYRYNAAGLIRPRFSDTLRGKLTPYLQIHGSRPFTVELSKIDRMPVVVPDKNAVAFMPNAWKDSKPTYVEQMPNPALKPSK